MLATERVQTIGEIQISKREALSCFGEIALSYRAAALAFGIPQADLRNIAAKHGSISICPRETEVIVSLHEGAGPKARDLWEEMLSSLNRGRGEAHLTKRAYVSLAQKLQRGLGKEWEGDIDLLQLALSVLWGQLPEGMQETLAGISPDKARSAVGIAGSTE